jgi:hypothetical protein
MCLDAEARNASDALELTLAAAQLTGSRSGRAEVLVTACAAKAGGPRDASRAPHCGAPHCVAGPRLDAHSRAAAGEQYEVMMVADPEAEEDDPRGGPRIAFQVVPAAAARPAPAPGWQGLAAAALLLLTLGTAAQLGLAANVSHLPKVRPPLCPSPHLVTRSTS